MSDTPIERDGSNAALPPDYPLLAWQPDPIAITAEDLDPPPYVAHAVEPIAGADFGLGIRHIENQLFITFDPWAALSVGDAFEYYMGDTRFAKAEDEIRSGEGTQRRYQLAIPRELVPTGSVFPCYGRVVRAGTGRESTSVQQEVFIKGTRPGGVDQDPELPYHSALKVHMPPDLQGPGAVLDPERAKSGVLCLIERYPEIYLGDTIELYWNGLPVTLQLDADHVAGFKPIEVLVPQAVIERGGSGRVTIRFRVHDLVFNYSGELQQWSQAVHLDTELDPSLLRRPFFLVDDVESTDVNFDTQGGSVFEIEVVVPSTLPDGTRAPPGSQIVVTLAGILLDGSSLVKQLPPFAARLDRSAFTDVDNDLIKQLINGSVQISYELQVPLGTVIGRSQRLMVTVFGTVVTMPPLDVRENESGLIDPAEPYITVDFPEYTPYDRSYPVTLRMEAPLPGGRVEFYEQTLQAGDPPPPTRFRIVPNDQFQRFVGLGDVRMFYLVNDGTADPRKSEDLFVQFGARVADMPKPRIEGLDLLDNLDPDNVIGQVIVTLPYINRLPGCTYVWRWVGSGVGGSTDGRINADFWIGNEVEFAVDKALVTANLDGEIRLSYSLERPGAQTLRSEVRVITVGKSLGDLPRPEVREASKSPDQLPPEAASAGATVVVEFDQMRLTDRIEMRWSGVSGIGTHTETLDGNTRKSVVFKVPAETIGVNIAPGGREINVQYFLIRGLTHPLPSRILTLRLLPLTTLPIPAIEGVADSPVLDTSTLNNGARTLVNVWQFANRAQRKWLTYTGVNANGSTYTENTYTGELINIEGETQGLLAPTPVNALRQLQDGSTLTIQAWISFERSTDKATALLFRERNYLVQALASVLPHPTLNGASGTGASVTVDPLSIENNTRVTVKYDGMRSTDRITLKWVYADAQAHSATLDGLDSGTQVFTLPVNVLARSVNSSVQVCYSVERSGVPDPVPSYVQTVGVNTLPAGSLPDPRINNLTTGATLDIASLTTSSSLTIAQWPMQYSGMKIWLTFSCPGASPTTYSPWTGHAHNSANGLSTILHQAWLDWLATCPNGERLSIDFRVGYVANATQAQAIPFPVTEYPVTNTVQALSITGLTDGLGRSITNDGYAATSTVTISGTATPTPHTAFDLYDGETLIRNVPAGAASTWSVVLTGVSMGLHRYQARGTSGTPRPVSNIWSFNNLAVITPTIAVYDSRGIVLDEGRTTDTTVTYRGTATPRLQVELFEDGTGRVLNVDTNGDWSYQRTGLTPRTYTVSVKALYANVESATQTFTVGAATQPLVIDQSTMHLNGYAIVAAGWVRNGQDYPGNAQTRTPSGGQSPYTYTSRNAGVASVNSVGKVTGNSNGSTTIDVRDNLGSTVSYNVSVSNVWHLRERRTDSNHYGSILWRNSMPGAVGVSANLMQHMQTVYGPIAGFPFPAGAIYWCCLEGGCGGFLPESPIYDSTTPTQGLWCSWTGRDFWAFCVQP